MPLASFFAPGLPASSPGVLPGARNTGNKGTPRRGVFLFVPPVCPACPGEHRSTMFPDVPLFPAARKAAAAGLPGVLTGNIAIAGAGAGAGDGGNKSGNITRRGANPKMFLRTGIRPACSPTARATPNPGRC